MNCPHCGKPINAAAIMAHQRNAKMTKAERSQMMRVAAKARWAKSTASERKAQASLAGKHSWDNRRSRARRVA